MANQNDYSIILLLRGEIDEFVAARICIAEIEQSISDWNDYWFPTNRGYLQQLKDLNKDMTKWPQSLHWNWDSKLRRVDQTKHLESYSIICEGKTQALSNCRHN